MPYPPSVDDPRDDVRPPTFQKGPWFGPVPRSRCFVSLSTASGPLSFLRDGVVIQADFFPTDPQPVGHAVWFGAYFDGFNSFGLTYESARIQNGAGVGFGQFSIQWSIPPTGNAIYRATGVNWTPGTPKTLPLLLNQTGQPLGSTCTVIWVPEWARPSERWPTAVITTPL